MGLWGCKPRLAPSARYDEARSTFRQANIDTALKLAHEGYRELETREPLWSWRFRLLEAEVLLWKGMFQQADALLAEVPPVNLPPDITARRKILQGRALCRLGKRAESEAAFNHADHLIEPADAYLQAELAFARGKCASLSDRAAAQTHYQQSADLVHGADNFIEARGLLDVGNILLQDEHYGAAIDRFNAALALTDSLLLREKTLGNLGYSYFQVGDFKRAIEHSKQAESIASELVRLNNQEAWIQVDQLKWLIDLGRAHFALREFQEAENYYLQALPIAQQLHDRDNNALCFHNLAMLALKKNDSDRAEVYRKEGEALNSERESLHFALDAAEIAGARKQFPESERLFQDLLPRTTKDRVLRSKVQRDLGKVYWQENKVALADPMFRAGISTAEMAMKEFTRDEYRMSFLDQDPFYDSYIQFLASQHKPVDALNVSERSRTQVLTDVAKGKKQRAPLISSAPLQAMAKQRKQVILAYSLTDEESFLWVITPSQFKPLRLPGHGELFSQIEACNREIQDHRNIEDSPGGQTLYQTLIQPAEKLKLIPKGSSVVIIPSKVLSLVNFEALIVPGPQPHYWIDDVDVQVTGSLALLVSAKSAPRKGPQVMKELLSLGAPVEASKDFPTLKHAPEEMRRVQGHFPADQTTIFSGKEATPQAYRASNPGQYRFLHLDTHGVASDLSPLESAIILSPGPDNFYKLSARDIKDIPLHADLVTISACYGAGTRWYQSEGLVGLAWAFMRAGAHQVVGALWEVDEASSPQLMDDFYGELKKGKSAAEALRAAKLKMLHSKDFYRHPYYWASLQLYTGP